jgi:hypothetical protein
MLRKIESFKVFDQDGAKGVHPVLLIDSHGIVQATQMECMCWHTQRVIFLQVDDREEHNGLGKIALAKERKTYLIRRVTLAFHWNCET